MKQKEIADLFDVSVSSIKKWLKEGFPKGGLKEQIRWVRENRPLTTTGTLAEARRDKIEVETQLRRLELLIKRGELISRQEIIRHNVGVISETKSFLLGLSRTLPPKIANSDPREQAGIIKKVILENLKKFHRRISKGC